MKNDKKGVTIYDLAKELNVSTATVSWGLQNSLAISSKARKRVQEMAKKMGYRSNHFARTLRRQRTCTIGIIIPRFNSHLMSTIVAGMRMSLPKQDTTSLSASHWSV